jgi:hypothetical protein
LFRTIVCPILSDTNSPPLACDLAATAEICPTAIATLIKAMPDDPAKFSRSRAGAEFSGLADADEYRVVMRSLGKLYRFNIPAGEAR